MRYLTEGRRGPSNPAKRDEVCLTCADERLRCSSGCVSPSTLFAEAVGGRMDEHRDRWAATRASVRASLRQT